MGFRINTLRLSSWVCMGTLTCASLVSGAARAAVLTDHHVGGMPLVVEVPLSSLPRILYLGALFVALAAILAWRCWGYLRNRAVASPSRLAGDDASPEVLSLVRTALAPKLMQWLKSQGVQHLVAQRDGLLSIHQRAEIELAKLEEMLMEVQAPLQERLRAYEQRIAELEQALQAKGDESRNVIETMIGLTRQKLEAERVTSSAGPRG